MFIHLRVHSAFSLLEGALHLKAIVAAAKADNQPAVALTDTANLFGALEFSEASYGAGIQPLVGCTVPVRLPEHMQNPRRPLPPARLPLLATSEDGFANLVQLVSKAYLDPATDGATMELADLAGRTDDVIALSGWVDGPVGQAFTNIDGTAGHELFCQLKEQFGDRFYAEVQRHGTGDEAAFEPFVLDMAYGEGVPLVATNEVFFKAEDDYEAHDALIAIADGRRVADDDRRQLTPHHHFKSQADMEALFADLPEAIASTVEIAKRTHFRPLKRSPMLPRFLSGQVTDPQAAEDAKLTDMAREGLERRFATRGLAPGVDRETYDARLNHELTIITRMQYSGYFLIVADFIQWAKANQVAVGPGRGSGAGSLVAYALTITDLDPLAFDLLFERFLNPERVSMPDFDIDFCQERRDRVISYVQGKYGADRVAQIITIGSLQARAVLRDVGRVLDMPYGKVDGIAKMVPSNPANPVTLAEALDTEPRLQEVQRDDSQVDRLLKVGMKLEGLFRHASTHAAGIVIGDRPLEQIVPLYRDPRSDLPVTQYNMKWVENAGLVKFDFLGLKTLTTIERALALIKEPIDLDQVGFDDPATYELLAKGETAGVFQLESAGMRKALIGMKPDRFTDIIAIVALYRPGPMDNIPAYNRRKHGLEEPDYLHDKLEPILKETYGIIIYQEQVMQIAQVLSGYSLGEADLLRRAMGKKIAAEMAVQRDRFVDGAVERGTSAADANRIFDLVAKFANYGFNKSHAAAYALIAYQTAWLKANHPHEFLAASMTLDMGNTEKLADFRAEAQRLDIAVEPPCINRSGGEFSVDDNAIRYGLGAVKGVGQPLVHFIEAEREKAPFSSLADFANRLDPKVAPKRGLEALVAAGAFDTIVKDRGSLFCSLDQVLGVANRVSSGAALGQTDFFGAAKSDDIRLPPPGVWTPAERLQREHDAIGFYLSAHPLDDYKPALAKAGIVDWRTFAALTRRPEVSRLAGTVISRQERRTRTGGRLGVIMLSDPSGQFEAVAFSDLLEAHRDRLEPGQSVVLTVTAQEREEGLTVRLQHVEPIDKVAASSTLTVYLDAAEPIASIDRLIREPGGCRVNFVAMVDGGAREVEIALKGDRSISPSVASAIKSMPGVVDVTVGS